ncbi:MAG TPA: TetR/AcrR family transcriptional regulator [Vicinamibacterales bacterium]|jgi:AcrR family transcriptional regulator|nr:TetR/AcrR family transcriptional regulator [Vicinamibacterales bacterium]
MPRHRFPNTRDRIETAAVHLFVEKGVADTTVRDIAGALEMSEGALYRHFPSKEQLVWQVFERHYIEFAGRLLKLAEAESGTRDKLAAMIAGFCRAYDENPRLFRFLLFVQHDQLAKLAADAPTPVEAVRMVIARGIAAGELPPQNADLATSLVFGVVLQPVQFAAYGRLPSDMGSVCDRLVAAAWAVVTTV